VAFEMAYSVRRRTCRGIDWDARSALRLSDAIVNSENNGLISISPIKCSSDSGALRYSIG
jgi:hypothetical protein